MMYIFLSPLMSSSFRFFFVVLFLFTSQLVSKPVSSSLSSKRIISEWKDINNAGLTLSVPFNTTGLEDCGIRLSPMKNNLLEWHFSFTGMEGTAFDGGIYHGKIILHPDYPRKAPVICVTTPSGRWEINVPICLSASAHHQELWNPNWNLRTLVLSLRAFMTTQPGEIGSILSPTHVHKALAARSRSFVCPNCGVSHDVLCTGSVADAERQDASPAFLSSDVESQIASATLSRRQKSPSKVSLKRPRRGGRATSVGRKTKNWTLFASWKVFCSAVIKWLTSLFVLP